MKRAVIESDGTVLGTKVLVDGVDVADWATEIEVRITPQGTTGTVKLVVPIGKIQADAVAYEVCANCAAELVRSPDGIPWKNGEPPGPVPERHFAVGSVNVEKVPE
jgi:hypothetical protein